MYKINEDEFIVMMLWRLYMLNEQLEQIERVGQQIIARLN